MSNISIIGAGLAGLVAAHAWPQAQLYEAAPKPSAAHKALLRFRSDAVAKLTGMEFRPVTVRKGIWSEDEFRPPSIRLANLYARKVLGRLAGDRSIWNLDPAQRFVAPETFYEQLVDSVGARVSWASPVDFAHLPGPSVSTAPLPVVVGQLGIPAPFEFERAPITVFRGRVTGADVFQTVYYPDADLRVYRASMTGDLLIIEMAGEHRAISWSSDTAKAICESFGIDGWTPLDATHQKFGKIAPVNDDGARRRLLFQLTHEHSIFSLGRFATWRNILLDDVVDDIAVIKRLIKSDGYERRRALA
jgi:hypothetical protein